MTIVKNLSQAPDISKDTIKLRPLHFWETSMVKKKTVFSLLNVQLS